MVDEVGFLIQMLDQKDFKKSLSRVLSPSKFLDLTKQNNQK